MCGIAGFTHRNSRSTGDLLDLALDAIRHRGPDQSGKFQSNAISMGAVRLKVIDLLGGDQPILSEDSQHVIVFNGEIYNHLEIRRELESLGHRFKSRCDTETVLAAFLQWDTSAFSRLRGMFAIAIWNEREQRLVLCRDRAGMKPLYYYSQSSDIFFASELKGLFVHPAVSRRVSVEGLNYYLSLNYVPAPYTLVDGILKVFPGHWLEWKNGKTRQVPFWSLSFEERERSEEEAVVELDLLLRDSVREHLVADVPCGLWLSGGMDSSTMLHYASESSSKPIKTFSIAFPGRSFDEKKYIHEASSQYETEHHDLELTPDRDLAGTIERMVYYSDEPSADAGALPVWFLSALTRQHVTVALSGEGADELFAGYQTYAADRYAAWLRVMPRALRLLLAAAASGWPSSDEKISFGYKLKRFTQGSLLSADEAHCYWNGSFSPEQKRDIARMSGSSDISSLFSNIAGAGLNRYLEFDTRFYLADDILYKSDRMSMAHSLEVRTPFLDHRIMEFAAHLPTRYKWHRGKSKVLLKRLMANKLPASVIRRSKQGLDIPTHDWFRGALRSFLLETLSTEALDRTGIFNSAAVQRLIAAHLERRADVGYQLWGLLFLVLWGQHWNIDFSPAAVPELVSEGAFAD